MQQPLSGVRVLDFTRVLAGPLCTMNLADLGAEVIKVEHPAYGDDTRQWMPPAIDGMSAYYASVNRNKQSMTLNLKSDEGQAIARRLIGQSQIVVENFKVGQMASYGLDYDSLKDDFPQLVYCSITGFGQVGLLHDLPGYDYAIQAMTGLMSITGEADGQPVKVGVAISDVITGLYATSAILGALRWAEQTGQGQYIDMALYDSQMAALVNVSSNYLFSGVNPARYGNQHQNIVPYQTFEAADGYFVLACGNDRQFASVCRLIGEPDWAVDERFSTNPVRVENRDLLVGMLRAVFIDETVEYWVAHLLEGGVPAAPIQTVKQAVESEHSQSRGLVQSMDGSSIKMMRSPLNLQATPPRLESNPPGLGEHTEQILADLLGMDASVIAAHREQGVI